MVNILKFLFKTSPICNKKHLFFSKSCSCKNGYIYSFKENEVYVKEQVMFSRGWAKNLLLKQCPKLEKNKITILETFGDFNQKELKQLGDFVFECFGIKEEDKKDYCLITSNKNIDIKFLTIENLKNSLTIFTLDTTNNQSYQAFSGLISDICDNLKIDKENIMIVPKEVGITDDFETALKFLYDGNYKNIIMESLRKQIMDLFKNKYFVYNKTSQNLSDTFETNKKYLFKDFQFNHETAVGMVLFENKNFIPYYDFKECFSLYFKEDMSSKRLKNIIETN